MSGGISSPLAVNVGGERVNSVQFDVNLTRVGQGYAVDALEEMRANVFHKFRTLNRTSMPRVGDDLILCIRECFL